MTRNLTLTTFSRACCRRIALNTWARAGITPITPIRRWRRGTLRRQIDPAARVILLLGKLNAVYDVRRLDPDRIRV
jgi:hypothetical protein